MTGTSVADGPHTPGRLAYRPGLDGLRAVAVLVVLGYHLELPGLDGGFLGVEVFFTLSGYLVTALLVAERCATGSVDLRRFADARARRLVPALLVCLLGTAVATALPAPADLPDLSGHVLGALLYVENWHLVLAEVPYAAAFDSPPLLHLWSLAVEGQLYLLWPPILIGCLATVGRRGTLAVTLTLAALSAGAASALFDGDSPGRVYYGTDTRASGFLIGAAVAVAGAGPVCRRLPGGAGVWGLVGLAVVFVEVSEFDRGLYERGGFAGVGLLTAAALAAAAQPDTLTARLLGRAPMVWLGKRSYGIYLYHWPILVFSAPLAESTPALRDIGAVAATLLVAAASYRWVELPVRRGTGMRDALRSARTVAVGAALLAVAPVMLAGTATSGAAPPTAPPSVTAVPDAASPAAETRPAEPPPPPPRTPVAAGSTPVLVVGDSVVLGSAAALRAAVGTSTVVDAAVGRQFSTAPAIVRAWAARNPGAVVVHLGSNGIVYEHDVDAVVAAAGGRLVVLVNVAVPRRWQAPDNAVLAAAAARHPDRVRLVDWAGVVARDPRLLGKDRVHPAPTGRDVLAAQVRAALGR
jgi:peptidoglycan/LPS O-acetylase OafA/YrhL